MDGVEYLYESDSIRRFLMLLKSVFSVAKLFAFAATSVSASLLLVSLVSCSSDESETIEPVQVSDAKSGEDSSAATDKTGNKVNPAESVDPSKPIVKPVDNCHVSQLGDQSPPMWLQDHGIVVTRILKDCITFDGRKGFEVDSPWMAMGLPCTGGGGKIDWKGRFYNPKLVSLVISTDCPMNPSSISVVKMAGQTALGLSPKAQLLAYNPFVVQYWEIPGLKDADVGFTVDLRSTEAKQRVWKNFLEQQSIPVRLYGRENAWVMGDHFYFVQGELVKTGTYTFKLEVKAVKAIKDEEMQLVKSNCESLRPSRKCYKVFKM